MTKRQPEAVVFERLQDVERHRARFAPELHSLVAQCCKRLPPGPVLELGAGDGQLTQHLPPAVMERCAITEPTPTGVNTLRSRFPQMTVIPAAAESLPVPSASQSAVIGACVFDVVESLPLVAKELLRVLVPGGVVVHMLDMATDLFDLFEVLLEDSTSVALPNVFTEPLDVDWPDDIMVVPFEQLALIGSVLKSAADRHVIADYAAQFRVDTRSAVAAFTHIQESRERREGLREVFARAIREAPESVRQRIASLQGTPLSSARVFHERAFDAFKTAGFVDIEAGLQTVQHDIPEARIDLSVVGFLKSGALKSGPGRRVLTCHVFFARRP